MNRVYQCHMRLVVVTNAIGRCYSSKPLVYLLCVMGDRRFSLTILSLDSIEVVVEYRRLKCEVKCQEYDDRW